MPTHGQLLLVSLGLIGYGVGAIAAIVRFRRGGQGRSGAVTGPLVLGLAAGAALIAWKQILPTPDGDCGEQS